MSRTISMTASDVVGALMRQSDELNHYLRSTPASDFNGDLVVSHTKRMVEFAQHIADMINNAKAEAEKQGVH